MLNSYLEVLKEVAKRYEHATALAQDAHRRCTYAHTIPGSVGCAIGCLFAPDIALLLESRSAANKIGAEIRTLYMDGAAKYHIDQVLDVQQVNMVNLTMLQRMHDGAINLTDFRRQLTAEISIRGNQS